METLECIESRRSIRKYKKKEIPDDILNKILEAAIHAPSAGNLQDWVFIVVKNKEKKQKLAEAAYGQRFVAEAPVVIVVCSDLKRISYYGQRGIELYSIQDAAAATQNLLLAAWDCGIGGCWIGAFDEDEVSKILSLPEYVRPLAIVPLGYPAEKPRKPARGLKDKVFLEEYGKEI